MQNTGIKMGSFQLEGFILFRDSRFVNFNVNASQQNLPHQKTIWSICVEGYTFYSRWVELYSGTKYMFSFTDLEFFHTRLPLHHVAVIRERSRARHSRDTWGLRNSHWHTLNVPGALWDYPSLWCLIRAEVQGDGAQSLRKVRIRVLRVSSNWFSCGEWVGQQWTSGSVPWFLYFFIHSHTPRGSAVMKWDFFFSPSVMKPMWNDDWVKASFSV